MDIQKLRDIFTGIFVERYTKRIQDGEFDKGILAFFNDKKSLEINTSTTFDVVKLSEEFKKQLSELPLPEAVSKFKSILDEKKS